MAAHVTQIASKLPKESITLNGVEYKLRKAATDSSVEFSHQRVQWLHTGCQPLNTGVYACTIFGIIPPTPNSLETPISVFYIGFSPTQVMMQPGALTKENLMNMHIYTSSGAEFAQEFVAKFLAEPQVVQTKPATISAFPPDEVVNG